MQITLDMNKRSLLAYLVLAFSFALLYRQVVVLLIDDWWRDENYSHGFLIVPMALYLAWERRHRFAETAAKPSWTGLALAAAAALVATQDMHPFVNRMALLVSVAGGLVFLQGWQRLRVMAFPLGFLLLMIPVPAIIFNQIAFPLQLVASRFGEWTLATCQVPVLREGNIIQLANTSLEVAEACSGIRSLVSLLTLGVIFGYFVESRIWIRVLLALATVPIAIVANGLRVAGTGLAAHFYGVEAAQGFFHSFSGWLVFLVAFGFLFLVHRLLVALAPAPQPVPQNGGPIP
jgi:exosortase